MKHGQLRSIAHSLAASLASGVSLITGFYDLDLYGDARNSPDGKLSIDLLKGKIMDGNPSPQLIAAVSSLGPEFHRLCEAEKISPKDCRSAKAYFYAYLNREGFTLVVEDTTGKVTETDYEGSSAQRAFERDALERNRRKAIRRIR